MYALVFACLCLCVCVGGGLNFFSAKLIFCQLMLVSSNALTSARVLQNLPKGLISTTSVALNVANKTKNRYKNICACEFHLHNDSCCFFLEKKKKKRKEKQERLRAYLIL